MKFDDETKPLYLETDASGIGFGTVLLQIRDGITCPEDIALDNTILRLIAFVSKSLTSAEHRYSNIEREALGILHSLEKFNHYCFAMEVSIITHHKSLVAIFSHPFTSYPVHPPQDTSIQGHSTIQARAGNFYCRLLV